MYQYLTHTVLKCYSPIMEHYHAPYWNMFNYVTNACSMFHSVSYISSTPRLPTSRGLMFICIHWYSRPTRSKSRKGTHSEKKGVILKNKIYYKGPFNQRIRSKDLLELLKMATVMKVSQEPRVTSAYATAPEIPLKHSNILKYEP